MTSLDYLIVGFYAIGLIALATYVSRTKKGQEKTPEDYFLVVDYSWWGYWNILNRSKYCG